MAEELGRIEKPPVEAFKKGRKLYFVPLIFGAKDSPVEYLERFNKYWQQVENQLADLELKLGEIRKIYHELVPLSGEDGLKEIEALSETSYQIIKSRIDKGASLEAIEESAILTEFMDWSRCLAIGLQNQEVFTKVYEYQMATGKKRTEYIAGQINETLKADEIGILFMREGHHVQFPSDVEVFYVAPPALDEINRWLRDLRPDAKEEK